MKAKDFILQHFQEIVVVGGVIFGYVSFQLELKDIPLEVEKLKKRHQTDIVEVYSKMNILDTRVTSVEKILIENNTKTDLLLRELYGIKADVKDLYVVRAK
jgi:hypothetical protein